MEKLLFKMPKLIYWFCIDQKAIQGVDKKLKKKTFC